MQHKCNKTELHTDQVMLNLFLTMSEDFSSTYGPDLCRKAKHALLTSGIKGFRDTSWPSCPPSVHPTLYKWVYQLENLFKRYRFADDVFTDEELSAQAKEKFLDTQIRIARPINVTSVVHRVLRQARVIATRILGEYDLEEHQRSCEFGKRACLGTPYRESYLDEKILNRPFTGSPEHISWFENCAAGDPFLSKILERAKAEKRICPCLDLQYTTVPKSWKAFRGIMPNTLLGSFYTAGLGRLLQKRLRNAGLNIRRLQKKHRRLAKKAAEGTRKLVTADLSSASDSLCLALLRWILPCSWYRAIVYGRARYVEVDGKRVLLSSIVTMGLGQTFPLQTLVFYCLVKAMGELDGRKHLVSVYGDDLIYSSHLHRYVESVFPKIHLILNKDKTYATGHFRESCGGDYYRNADVRPYQPEGGSQHLVKLRKQSFLYRLYNGITTRWDPVQVPVTLDYLLAEMSLDGPIHQVPPDFPDGAGVRLEVPSKLPLYHPVRWSSDSCSTCTENSCLSYKKRTKCRIVRDAMGGFEFKYLHEESDDRCVQSKQAPYVWEKLRASAQEEPELELFDRVRTPALFLILKEYLDGQVREDWVEEADIPRLRWRKAGSDPKYVKSRITHRSFRRTIATVTKKGSGKIVVKRASKHSWLFLANGGDALHS